MIELAYLDRVSRAWLFLKSARSRPVDRGRGGRERPRRGAAGRPARTPRGPGVLVEMTVVGRRRAGPARDAGASLSRHPRIIVAGLRGAVLRGRAADRQNDGVFVAGMGAAVLLGNLRNDVQARVGLAIVLGGAADRGLQRPDARAGDLVFTPAAVRDRLAGRVRAAGAHRADRGRRGARGAGPSGTGRLRPGSRSRRSAGGSHASSTTSSRTPSA